VYALTHTLWDNYRLSQYDAPDDEDWGELNVSFRGTANFYLDRRDAPARVRNAGGTEPSPGKPNVSAWPLSETAIIVGVLIALLVVGGLVFGSR
jgi:hypothetical protein